MRVKRYKKIFRNAYTKIKKNFKLKKINNFVTVISSYSIFFGIMIFIIGLFIRINITEDDLILNDIKKQLPINSEISSIIKDDIHGFGNETIAVMTVNKDYNKNEKTSSPNQLSVYDKVENDILKNIYRPLGFGSSYHMKYKLSLRDDEGDILYTLTDGISFQELTGDMFKEIVVPFTSMGASGWGASNDYCIISWIDGEYQLIGSFPTGYDEYLENTEPLKKEMDNSYGNRYYWNSLNKNDGCYVNSMKTNFPWYFIDINDDEKKELVIFASVEDHLSLTHLFRIDMYEPFYNRETNKLEWSLSFSKELSEKFKYSDINQDYINHFITENKDDILYNNNISQS